MSIRIYAKTVVTLQSGTSEESDLCFIKVNMFPKKTNGVQSNV